MKTPPENFRVYTPASIGAAIRHFRQKSGLSQAELARKANLHRSYLSAIEKGHETEHVRRLFRILKQLGVRMNLEQASW
jgi:transcriptional regulator with XRE-family HTH domain